MERILIGLPEFSIEKMVSTEPLVFEASWTEKLVCPYCKRSSLRMKDSFWRFIRNIPHQGRSSLLKVRCHKYCCKNCRKYFNTRLPSVKKCRRSKELLKATVFLSYNTGYSSKDIAVENNIGVASVERFYQQMISHKVKQRKNKQCPRVLGIDEHRFTKKRRFLTIFCDLEKRSVFDLAEGRSAAELKDFLKGLKGRDKVEVVCIDMNTACRSMVREWFPKARIVTDRFHVIRLVNHHFSKTCKMIDDQHLAYGRGGLIRIMLRRPDRLTEKQKIKLGAYLKTQPVIESLYVFCQDLNELLRTKAKNKSACKKYVSDLLERIRQLKEIPFAPLQMLGKTLLSWQEEVARMFRYVKNNGITEGFHRKMKLIQRRAYGFRNFENYRLRVKVLCG